MSRVIVIGGGAAGMMAAAAAAENAHQVILFEKNEKLGKKIYITGKGRCNLTNACETEELFRNICTNSKFLYSAVYGFDNMRVMDFFEQAGCRLKVERGNRVFPVSDHASDVIAALRRVLQKYNVKVCFHSKVRKLLLNEEEHRITGVQLQDGSEYDADQVIVATGGLSYPTTGSTGDGYRFAKLCGHKVMPCSPSLVSLHVKEAWCGQLTGLSLKNVAVKLKENDRVWYENRGEMLFTHRGVSGPLILSASSIYAEKCEKRQAQLEIDLKPALSKEQLDKRLLREFEENKKKQFKNGLGSLFPAKLIPVMLSLSGIDPEKKVHEISREERKCFADLIKALPLTVVGTGGYEEAVITKGGVCVREVNPSTMESKLVKGLYFAGEVLDVDAYTGGFNLQIAWSTGWLAGNSVQ